MARQDIELQKELEPQRMEYAKNRIAELGFEILYESATELRFLYKNETVRLFPYSGWHSGKSITDGRGIKNLIEQIK